MRSVLTVSVRSVVAVGVLVAVILAYAVGSLGGASTAAGAAEEPGADASAAGEIVMRGAGEATGVPDQLSFKLSVNVEATDVSVALDRANAKMRRVLAGLTEIGVERRDVQTTGLRIRPVYDYSGEGPALLTGYAVSEKAGVLVRSLPDAGAAIATAVDAGGNAVRVHGVRLEIGDEAALLREARDSAVAEASAKARQYAGATGQELGDVVSIKEIPARSGRAHDFPAQAALDAAVVSKVPIRAGSADLSVVVAVTWELP